MKIKRHLFSLILIFTAFFGQGSTFAQESATHRFYASLQGTVGSRDLVSEPRLGVRAAFGIAMLGSLTPGISYSTASLPLEHDNVSGVATTDLTISGYRIHLAIPIFSGSTSLLADAGIGLATVSTKPITISLGALGNKTLPAQQDQLFAYSLGLVFRQNISGNVALEIQPEALFLPSSSSVGNLYSIGGGLNIGIL